MDLTTLRERIQHGSYLVKSHAIQHAIKEGFGRDHIVEAILNGRIIESYPEDKRMLICGRFSQMRNQLYLHVVCEYSDPVYVEFVTAYLPDEDLWEHPPYRRCKQKR